MSREQQVSKAYRSVPTVREEIKMKLEDRICPFVDRLCDTRCSAYYNLKIGKNNLHGCVRLVQKKSDEE